MEKFAGIKVYLALSVLLTLLSVVFVSQTEAGVLKKRSVQGGNPEICRTGGVCGWEVYDKYSRKLQYYISSSCVCRHDEGKEETCIRMEDEVATNSYTFRCAVRRKKVKTTSRPSNSVNVDADSSNASTNNNTTS